MWIWVAVIVTLSLQAMALPVDVDSAIASQNLMAFYPSEYCESFRNDTKSRFKLDPETVISLNSALAPDDPDRGFAKSYTPSEANKYIRYCLEQSTGDFATRAITQPFQVAARGALCLRYYMPFKKKNEETVTCWMVNFLTSSGQMIALSPSELATKITALSGKLPENPYNPNTVIGEGETRGEIVAEEMLSGFVSGKSTRVTAKEVTIGTGFAKHIPDPRVFV